MARTTQEDIRGWLREATRQKATHMVVACDTFDYEDYPIYVLPGQNVQAVVTSHNGPNMQKVMEVYAMHLPLEDQLREHRSWHLEAPPVTAPAKKTAKPKTLKKRVKKRKSVWDRIRKPEL